MATLSYYDEHHWDPVRLFRNGVKLHHYVLNTCYPVSKKARLGSHSCENNKKILKGSLLIAPTNFIRTISPSKLPWLLLGGGRLGFRTMSERGRERQGRRRVMYCSLARTHWAMTLCCELICQRYSLGKTSSRLSWDTNTELKSMPISFFRVSSSLKQDDQPQ